MGFFDLLKKKQSLPQKDFYTYQYFEHSEELKEALPEKEALLKLPVQERANMLAQKVVIHHLSPDGDQPVLSVAPYLMRFPVDNMIELLKGLPEIDQMSLLNTYVEEQGYRSRPFLFILPGSGGGYERMGVKRTVYERCLSSYLKAEKMEEYVSSLSTKTQDEINKKLRKDFTHPYTKTKTKERKQKSILKGLDERLAEISDLEKVKTMVKPARTPERTEQLARVTRVRKAKAILSEAAREAQKSGDKKTLQEIVEMAKPYAVRESAIRDKFHQRRLARRDKKGRG